MTRQLQQTERWCNENGYNLIDPFVDLGRSAYTPGKQDALKDLLGMLESGEVKADLLIVESLDRLSRQKITTAMSLFLQIIEYIPVLTLTDRRLYKKDDPNISTDLIISLTILYRGFDESQQKSKRVKAAFERGRAERTTAIGGGKPRWITSHNRKWVLITEKAEVIKRIFMLRTEKGMGFAGIARLFNDEGVPTLSGKGKWWPTGVKNVVKSKTVIGYLVRDNGEEIDGMYPPIVDRDVWEAAQPVIVKHTGGKPSGFVNIFRGMFRCAEHGQCVTIIWDNYHSKRKMVCIGHTKVEYNPVIEREFIEYLERVDFGEINSSSRDEMTKLLTQKEHTERAIARLEDGMLELVESGVSLDRYRERVKERKDELLEIEQRLLEIKPVNDFDLSDLDLECNDDRMKINALLRRVVKRILVDLENECIYRVEYHNGWIDDYLSDGEDVVERFRELAKE